METRIAASENGNSDCNLAGDLISYAIIIRIQKNEVIPSTNKQFI